MIPKRNKRKPKWCFDNLEWEEYVTGPLFSAFNLDKAACGETCSKKNCENIFCINNFAIEKYSETSVPSDFVNDADVLTESSNYGAGLKNYGGTCYLNSLLQVYYNITDFREAIFDYPIHDIQDEVILYLQTIFANMQLSIHRSVDPVELIMALQLPHLEQQDAPEFHSLFLNLLDLRYQCIGRDINRIKRIFTGSINYITRCKGCGYESRVLGEFRELDLKTMPSLDQSLNDYLKVEILTGDNKYHCSSCSKKCDSERQTVLKSLPPLLCFQILRYSYDNCGKRKKNSSNVTFPICLSMTKFVEGNKSDHNNDYIIKSILIHLGTEPIRGHYQTLIHSSDQGWIFYDDLNVQKLDSLEQVQKILGSKKAAQTKSENNGLKKLIKDKESSHFTSSNAYMIFYERKDLFDSHCNSTDQAKVPLHLQETIRITNESYLSDLENKRKEKKEIETNFQIQSVIVKDALEKLKCNGGFIDLFSVADTYEFLPSAWLKDWVKNCINRTEISIDDYWKNIVCIHGGIGSSIVQTRIKAVSSVGVDYLIKENFLPPNYKRYRIDDFCQKCWQLSFQIKKFDSISRIDVDLDNVNKSVDLIEYETKKYFWVSKSHLRHWRKYVRKSIESIYGDKLKVVEEDGDNIDNVHEPSDIFNSDLLCVHKKLAIDYSKRIIIEESKWKKLLSYFPLNCNASGSNQYIEFPYEPNTQNQCDECTAQLEGIQRKSSEEKSCLSSIFQSKKRFDYSLTEGKVIFQGVNFNADNTSDDVVLYAVPTSFISQWKRFIKNPSTDTILTEVDYADVYCSEHEREHNSLNDKLFCKSLFQLIADDILYLVLETEWIVIKQCYPNLEFEDLYITIDGSGYLKSETVDLSNVCNKCFKEWQEKQTSFYDSVVYVRSISLKPEQNPENNEEVSSKKKIKLSKKPEVTPDQNSTEFDFLRRSQRCKRQRTDVPIRVNSEDTVQDLKVKLMNFYFASPLDQHLIFNDTELDNPKATLISVGIVPSSIINIIIDTEPVENSDLKSNETVETGFMGTKLMGS